MSSIVDEVQGEGSPDTPAAAALLEDLPSECKMSLLKAAVSSSWEGQEAVVRLRILIDGHDIFENVDGGDGADVNGGDKADGLFFNVATAMDWPWQSEGLFGAVRDRLPVPYRSRRELAVGSWRLPSRSRRELAVANARRMEIRVASSKTPDVLFRLSADGVWVLPFGLPLPRQTTQSVQPSPGERGRG